MVGLQFDIRRFDIYRKVPKDLTQPTYTGAFISVIGVALILFLFVSELIAFIKPEIDSILYVDDPGEDAQLPVYLDITIPEVVCDALGVDIQDEMGRHEVGNFQNLKKDKVNNNKGCRLYANFKINKVPGNFHVSTHAKSELAGRSPVFKHKINQLIFGPSILANISKYYGVKHTSFDPLNNVDHINSAKTGRETYEYHLKIVPTIYSHGGQSSSQEIHGYQFTAISKTYETTAQGARVYPAVWFRYQLTPITVKYSLKEKPLYHLITTVCAIVGGTFTVTGIIDSCIFTAHEVFKKMEIGKLN